MEILTDLKGKSPIDLRLEGGGIILVASFDNTTDNDFEAHMVLPPPVAMTSTTSGELIPITGVVSAPATVSTSADRVWVKSVQKGGHVTAAIYDLEFDTNFKVYISEAGMSVTEGYPVGGIRLSNTSPKVVVGTFEIPYKLHNTLNLTLYVVGPNYTLSTAFVNEKK